TLLHCIIIFATAMTVSKYTSSLFPYTTLFRSVLTNWEQRSFAATLQPFLVVGTASAVVMKVIVNGGVWPHLQIGTWIGLGLVLAAGLVGGDWLSRRIDVGIARAGMLVLAFGGGIAALIKGAVGLV